MKPTPSSFLDLLSKYVSELYQNVPEYPLALLGGVMASPLLWGERVRVRGK
jgi:hypothetical protein